MVCQAIGSRAMARTRSMKAVALVVALASLTINFGLIDLIDGFTGFVDQARNQVLDAGLGTGVRRGSAGRSARTASTAGATDRRDSADRGRRARAGRRGRPRHGVVVSGARGGNRRRALERLASDGGRPTSHADLVYRSARRSVANGRQWNARAGGRFSERSPELRPVVPGGERPDSAPGSHIALNANSQPPSNADCRSRKMSRRLTGKAKRSA